eukprot:13797278-Alexandrium_andersonii.AAC.1
MALLSFAMTPWVRRTEAEFPCASPRVLADDMLVTTIGSAAGHSLGEHYHDHTAVVQASVDYIYDLGSQLSAKKCVTLADHEEL